MKKIILLLLCVVSISTTAQTKYGSVVYNVQLSPNEKFEKLNDSYDLAKNGANQLEFILNFDSEKSYFFLKDCIETPENAKARAFSIGNKTYFNTKNEKATIIETNSPFLGQFYISEDKNNNWVISNEKKKIDNLDCYKASITNSQNELITAWFCPSIPYPFGPKGYGNLPGLIVELHEKNAAFGIKKINLNITEPLQIIEPSKKVISQEEYDMMLQKYLDSKSN